MRAKLGRRILRLACLGLLGVAGGCLSGNAECNGGDEQCVGTTGAYRTCDGGEGYYYWSDRQCPGVQPQCQQVAYRSNITCVELAPIQDCPQSSPPLLTGTAQAIRLIDVTGDGALDLQFDDGTLAIGNGAGTFQTPQALPVLVAGQIVDSLPADLNHDGIADLAVTSKDPGEIYAFYGTGQFNYALAARYFYTYPPALNAAADLDGDGKDELVGCSYNEGVHIISHLGGSNITDRLVNTDRSYGQPLSLGPQAEAATVADFDGVAPLDLAALVDEDYAVYLANPDGSYQSPRYINYGYAIGDLDGDGRADIVGGTITEDEDPQLVLSFAGPTADFAQKTSIKVPYKPVHAVIADFDHDGLVDIGVTFRDSNGRALFGVLVGKGQSTFDAPQLFVLPGLPTSDLSYFKAFAGDVDSDGRSDLIMSRTGAVIVFPGGCLPQ